MIERFVPNVDSILAGIACETVKLVEDSDKGGEFVQLRIPSLSDAVLAHPIEFEDEPGPGTRPVLVRQLQPAASRLGPDFGLEYRLLKLELRLSLVRWLRLFVIASLIAFSPPPHVAPVAPFALQRSV